MWFLLTKNIFAHDEYFTPVIFSLYDFNFNLSIREACVRKEGGGGGGGGGGMKE